MSTERRYNEHEIAEIFGQAAEAETKAQRQLSHTEGLTLAELQEIGSEVGITSEFITRAAAAVGGQTDPEATFLGLPVSVSHTVDLPGDLSETDWDRLIVDLRSTFRAPGKVHGSGSLREWRNGNLHALVEPTETGHRLHLSTFKGNARGAVLGGLAIFALCFAITILAIYDGYAMDRQMLVMAMFSALGLGIAGAAAYRLPSWARERKNQMQAIAGRATDRATAGSGATLRESDTSSRVDRDSLLGMPESEDERESRQARIARERE